MSTMQYASSKMRHSDEAALSGGKPAGQETSDARAWSGTEDVPDQAGAIQADASAIASLSGGAFVFDDSWLGTVTEASSLNGGLPLSDFTAALEGVSAALSGYAVDGVLAGVSVDVPIWSLSHDGFGNI